MKNDLNIPWPEWEIVRVIGRGGFGTVYEIQKDVFGKKEYAALKVLSIPESAEEIDELYSRGYDEQSISAHFKGYLEDIVGEYSIMVDLKGHANVVYCDEVKYVQHEDGIGWDIFIKMELLKPLNKISATEYKEEEVIRLGKDLCNALIYCSQQNIIHRDIKPQNVFVSKIGSYKLGDFGVAKVSDKTMSGTKIGTYEYMAPEVYRAQRYGSRVDIYSLGLVMYWMMNQKCTPFLPLPPQIPTASEKESARNRRLDGEQIPPPVNGSDRLKAIVLKACAFDPQNRYASAQDMLNALQNIAGTARGPIPEPVDLDVHKEMTFEHTNHPAGKYLSVQVDEREVHFSVPMDIKDGQTMHLAGKGKCDRSTGALGDLYITVHIKEAPPQPIAPNNKTLYIVIAAVAVVLAMILCIPKNKPTSTPSVNNSQQTQQISIQEEKPKATNPPATQHVHSWKEATYNEPKTCSSCGETLGISLCAQITGDAKSYAEAGQYRKAIQLLDESWAKTGEQVFYDMAGEYRMEFGIQNTSYITAGKYNSILIKDDGKVVIVGDDEYDELDAQYWSDIAAVSAGDRHIVGLRSDGTVVSVGDNTQGQRATESWSNVVAIAAGDVHTIALLEDGTLVAAGQLWAPRCDVDGLLSQAGDKRIVSIAAGYLHSLALLEDGTVIAVGENGNKQCAVEHWSNIAAIYAGTDFSLGLKTDGSVVVAGVTNWNISGWADMVNLAAGDYFVVGITSESTLLSEGMEENIGPNTPHTISYWTNVAQVAAGHDHIITLSNDGILRCAGKNEEKQINLDGFSITYPRD